MIIKEFLPNSLGNDKEGEYIKIFNDGNSDLLLDGWSIKDLFGKTYNFNGILDRGKELLLPYSQTKISLNNNGEQLFLYDAEGKLVNELGYNGQASEGQIINKELMISTQTASVGASNQLVYNQITNSSITTNFIFLDILTAVILASVVLHIILQSEKKLGIKLF